jgi:hypothetical protein
VARKPSLAYTSLRDLEVLKPAPESLVVRRQGSSRRAKHPRQVVSEAADSQLHPERSGGGGRAIGDGKVVSVSYKSVPTIELYLTI